MAFIHHALSSQIELIFFADEESMSVQFLIDGIEFKLMFLSENFSGFKISFFDLKFARKSFLRAYSFVCFLQLYVCIFVCSFGYLSVEVLKLNCGRLHNELAKAMERFCIPGTYSSRTVSAS